MRLVAFLFLIAASCGPCSRKPPPLISQREAIDALAGDDDDRRVRPVYPASPGQEDPVARTLCEALHTLPETRKQQCCKLGAAPAILTQECVRVVSAAVRNKKAVGLNAAAVERCAAALDQAHRGCDWVGPWEKILPAECAGLFAGRWTQGEPCSSSLECAKGLRCRGVGPTQAGVCAPPRGEGEPCGTAVDPLAVYARQDDEGDHPECDGFCGTSHRCFPRVPVGGACTLRRECGSDAHCAAGRCAPGSLAALGEACLGGGCEKGRCIDSRCAMPRLSGAACVTDEQCAGACLAPDGGARVCGMICR